MLQNRKVVLASRPDGNPKEDNFRIETGEAAEPGPGEMLVRVRAISMEPAIRGWLDDNDKNYFEPIPIGGTLMALSMGQVVKSNLEGYDPGDFVRGLMGWEDYTIVNADTVLLTKLDIAADMPLTYYVGVLGGSGQTPIVGLDVIGRMKPGETVVMSAAVGAVGHIGAQYAKHKGCRVVGIAGGPEKCRIALDEMGYDAVIDYKSTDDLDAAIREACPEGVDIYYDNVGGPTLDAMFNNMNTFGRIVCCGMIAGYNRADDPPPLYNAWQIVTRELELKGFLLYSYGEHLDAALETNIDGLRSGWLNYRENKMVGIANAPRLFCELMSGRTVGKSVLEMDLPERAD
ncbi:NADP-dependent oxidoreductase [Croceicoccus ponticola]|uniref:NADP-dependent oxidoreductase n=1 Tax=Croceicoccus ponticola TaxID=2217664 RepID=UPI0013E40486|nr:NADP-dependent oxidoreductase [Croceicoccus ponticola]